MIFLVSQCQIILRVEHLKKVQVLMRLLICSFSQKTVRTIDLIDTIQGINRSCLIQAACPCGTESKAHRVEGGGGETSSNSVSTAS